MSNESNSSERTPGSSAEAASSSRAPGEEVPGLSKLLVACGFEAVGAAFDGADVNIVPLARGEADIEVHVIRSGSCALHRQPARTKLFAEASVSKGTVGMILITRNDEGARYNGQRLAAGTVVLYGPGAAHTGVGGGRREALALTFPLEQFRSSLASLLLDEPPDILGRSLILSLGKGTRHRMERLLREPEAVLRVGGDVDDAGLALREETVPEVCELLADTLAAPVAPSDSARGLRESFHQAREFIHQHYGQPLQLVDLCRAVGVSAESLRLAFRQHTGLPPMRYLKTFRLMRSHDLLLRSGPDQENVKTVARACGIRELGRFAGAYRRLYGRLPKEDLLRPRDTRPAPLHARVRGEW